MSIGVVVADAETKKEIDSVYYIIEPEYRVAEYLWCEEAFCLQCVF